MFLIQGPFPSNSSSVVLPSPEIGNTEGVASTVQTLRMMDNSLRTYVKRKYARKKFRWTFTIGHLKAKQLEDFVVDVAGSPCQVIWRDTIYTGHLTLNPYEADGETSEFFSVTLEFEEIN